MDRISSGSLILVLLPLTIFYFSTSLALHTTGGTTPNTLKMPDLNINIKTTRANSATRPPSSNPDFGKTNPPEVTGKTIQQACQEALHRDLCIQTLTSHPESKSLDLKGMAFLALRIAKETASDNVEFLSKKLGPNEENLDAGHDRAYHDCSEQYSDAVAQLEDSIVAFYANAWDDINIWVSAALTSANTCGEGLNETGANNKDMADRNDVFKKLCSNVLAVVHVVSNQ